MTTSTEGQPRRTLACDQCQRTFDRPSHLKRHRLTHVPHGQRQNSIHCLHCDRTFSRQDVLLRHLRASHGIQVLGPATQQKSCHRCVRQKLRCNRLQPCSSCQSCKDPAACSYPLSSQSRTVDEMGRNGVSVDRGSSNDGKYSNGADQGNLEGKISLDMSNGYADFSQSLDAAVMEDGCSPIFDSGNTPSDGNGTIYSQSHDASLPLDFRGAGLDWLDFDISNIDFILGNDVAADGSFLGANAIQNIPPEDVVQALPAIQPRKNILPWPFEQGKELSRPRFPLPRLQDVLQRTPRPGSERPNAVDIMMQLLSQRQFLDPDELVTPEMSSGFHLLQQLMDSYFIGFQIIQPIVHVPTWTIAQCPTTLLAAMACIGSVLSSDAKLSEVSDAVSEFCSSMITWLVSESKILAYRSDRIGYLR